MLGYSQAMHKLPILLMALTIPASAAPQTRSPPTPLLQRAPITIAAPDPALKAALEATSRGNLSDLALAGFRGQPLAGWLEYASLRKQLDTLPIVRGNAFLTAHKGEAVGDAFRNEWLSALAKRNEWPTFLNLWDAGIEDVGLRCQRLTALAASNRIDKTWTNDAQALWRSSGKSLPGSCDAPFALLAARGELSDALRWQRFDLAVSDAQPAVMRSIARGLPAADAAQANAYAAFFDKPDAALDTWPKTPRSRLVASMALARLAKSAPDRAEALLPSAAKALAFGEPDNGRVLAQIALWTVASYLPESARRLAAVPESAFDDNLREWRVREALTRSDWPAALAAIRKMPDAQRNDSRWLYFAARTSELGGDSASAKALYAQAARKTDFYGFLAADRLNQPYALCPWQLDASAAAKAIVARSPAMVRALQLYMLDRKGWAVREWNDALSGFTDEQRRLAVEVAQDNGWFDRGVFALVNVGGKRYPDEQRLYQLRFPLHHEASIRREATRNHLDPAWVAAEIRAESVFDPNARSAADARGLMQVLPGTGASVAAKLGLAWGGGDSLFDADTNITLGSAYLRQLMDRYGGKPYQVIAGYNAGPAPLNRWISQRPDFDPDLWIETIGYKETREYVARVLSFSTVYDWRLNGDALRLSDRLLGITTGPRKGFECPVPDAVKTAAPPTVAPPANKPQKRR